ncbi:MAG: hypothetical protein SF097_25350 [Acidobacteriota bacterium]|nr:hypothetical protein [Acidobacteriota bacterium]
MVSFNPFLVDEIVTQTGKSDNQFGLISGSESYRTELHGFEVTMSGKLALPELHPQNEQETKN